MKLVINQCFGGASLSPLGVKRAVEYGVPLSHWEFNKKDSICYQPDREPNEDLGDGFLKYGEGNIMWC